MVSATVRCAEPADVPAIVEMLARMDAGDGGTRSSLIDGPHLEREVFGPAARAGALVADAGRALVGLAAYHMSFTTFASLPELYLDDLWVAPESRRRGIARAMLGELARTAARRGAHRILLNVQSDNPDAVAFYTSLGAVIFEASRPCAFAGEALERLARDEPISPRPERAS